MPDLAVRYDVTATTVMRWTHAAGNRASGRERGNEAWNARSYAMTPEHRAERQRGSRNPLRF